MDKRDTDSIGTNYTLSGKRLAKWERHLQAVIRFKQANGHIKIPRYDGPHTFIYAWVARQKINWRDGKLPQECIDKLQAIGIELPNPSLSRNAKRTRRNGSASVASSVLSSVALEKNPSQLSKHLDNESKGKEQPPSIKETSHEKKKIKRDPEEDDRIPSNIITKSPFSVMDSVFSQQEKVAIVEELINQGPNETIGELCEKYKISHDLLFHWRKLFHDEKLLMPKEVRRKVKYELRYRPIAEARRASQSDISSVSSMGSRSSMSASEEESISTKSNNNPRKRRSRRKSSVALAAEQGISHKLFKAYSLAKKNREWLLSNKLDSDNEQEDNAEDEEPRKEKSGGAIFSLEMQRQYVKERKQHIAKVNGEIKEMIMTRRLQRELEETNAKDAKIMRLKKLASSCSQHKDPSFQRIPSAVAKIIMKNIKQRGIDSVGNVEEEVIKETHRVLQQLSSGVELKEQPDASNSKSGGHGNTLNNGEVDSDISRQARINPIDWYKRGRDEEDRGEFFENMSISNIDNLVGWATSYSGNTCVKDSNKRDQVCQLGLSHIPVAPPPPSQIEFLLNRFVGRMAKTLEPGSDISENATIDNNNSQIQQMKKKLDASALVSIGMGVEDVMTMALLPLARAHVDRCRRLEKEKHHRAIYKDNSQPHSRNAPREDPYVAWTLPPNEAAMELTRDNLVDHNTCYIPSSKPPTVNHKTERASALNSAINSKSNQLDDAKDTADAFYHWCNMQGLDPITVRNNKQIFGIFCENTERTPP